MKKYISFFKIRFSMGLQYRTAALAGVVTQFAWGSVSDESVCNGFLYMAPAGISGIFCGMDDGE